MSTYKKRNNRKFDIDARGIRSSWAKIDRLYDKNSTLPNDSETFGRQLLDYVAILANEVNGSTAAGIRNLDESTYRTDDGYGGTSWDLTEEYNPAIVAAYDQLAQHLKGVIGDEFFDTNGGLRPARFKTEYNLVVTDSDGVMTTKNAYVVLKQFIPDWMDFDFFARKGIADKVLTAIQEDSDLETTLTDQVQKSLSNNSGAFQLPVGTTVERPAPPVVGQVRYNETISSFEGYSSGAWSSLGGVKDVDQDTYIQAESVANADEDVLVFVTAGVERASIDSDGLRLENQLNVKGITTLEGDLRGPATMTIDPLPHAANTGEVIIAGNLTVQGTQTTINSTTLNVTDIDINAGSGGTTLASINNGGFLLGDATLTNRPTLLYSSSLDGWTVNKDFVPSVDSTYDLGTNTQRWGTVYADQIISTNATVTGVSPTLTLAGDASGTTTFTDLGNATLNLTLTKDPVITLAGVVTGSATMTNLGNVTINTVHTADPVITLTGAVTGTGTMTNLGNVSIATTHTADPTLTLAGDVTGTATFTNLGNATLTAVVVESNVNHDLLANFVANEHIDHSTVSIIAGAGLTGGGTIAASRTLNIVGANGITVNADDIQMSGTYTGNFSVTGTITATGDITAFSDRRLKTDIQPLDGKKVLQMNGVSFIKDGSLGSGVIAQEIEEVAPELVHTNEDGMKSVAYGNLVGYLIESIKDLQQQIDELKK